MDKIEYRACAYLKGGVYADLTDRFFQPLTVSLRVDNYISVSKGRFNQYLVESGSGPHIYQHAPNQDFMKIILTFNF